MISFKKISYAVIFIVILFCYNQLYKSFLYHRNNLPGLRNIKMPPNCCSFDSQMGSSYYDYEPAFVELSKTVNGVSTAITSVDECENENIEISVLFQTKFLANTVKKYKVCKNRAKKLFNSFSIMKNNIQNMGLEKKLDFLTVKLKDEKSDSKLISFICCGDDLICLSINGWIFPLSCNFLNLLDSNRPSFNMLWKFSSYRTFPTQLGFKIDLNQPIRLSLKTLTEGTVKIEKINKDRFILKKVYTADLFTINKKETLTNLASDSTLLTISKPKVNNFSTNHLFMYASYIIASISVFLFGFSAFTTILKSFSNQPTEFNIFFGGLFITALLTSFFIIFQIAFIEL